MKRCLLVSAVGALVLAAAAVVQPVAADAERIAGLTQKLGSENFAERERARAELEKIGVPALEALRKAAASDDLETSRRAGELVRKIEEKLQNDDILSPKRVHLKLNDATIAEAVAELAKQSGYDVRLAPNAKGTNRKLTLDTGATTFWQALDQLCAAAGLVEDGPQTMPAVRPAPRPGIRRQIRALPQPVPLPVPQQQNNGGLQIQQGQIQIQIQGNVQIQPGIAPIQFAPAGAQGSNSIVLTTGAAKTVPTSYSGAARVRLTPASQAQRAGAPAGQHVLVLDVDAEPRLHSFSLAASPQIDKAIDEHGQSLELVMEQPNANADPNELLRQRLAAGATVQRGPQAVVRLRGGDQQAKMLKEFSGTLSAQARTATEPLVVIKDVFKAAGQVAKGNGCTLQLNSIDKQPNGDVKVDVALEFAAGQNVIPGINVLPGGGIQIQQIQQIQVQIGGNAILSPVNGAGLPALVDADGNSYRLIQIPSRRVAINNGASSTQATLLFRANAGQGEADRLVLSGQRTVTFNVPFSFTNVPLE